MKRYIPLLLVLTACNSASNESTHQSENITDSITTDSNEITFPVLEPIAIVNPYLDTLLNAPLDLETFKKEWGPSNSGGGSNNGILDIPDTTGQVYRYFLFHKLRSVLPDHPSEGELLNNFIITVFKYGKEIGDFYDSNEKLLMIACSLDNPELGELNWYGQSTVQIMDKYGPPQYEKENCLIYQIKNKTITAHLNNEQVDWYKYVLLNESVDLSKEIPGILLDF